MEETSMDQAEGVRRFFDVLPDLKVEDKLMQLFSIVDVEKVVLDNSTHVLMFYLRSRELIHHAQIIKMQEYIKNKLFPNTPVIIALKETYTLSEQYTLKYITEAYKDSLLYEISAKSEMFSAMIRLSEWNVEGDTLTITLDNSLFARRKAEEVKTFLEKVYRERFNHQIQICFEFRVCENSMLAQENEQKLKREVSTVMGNVRVPEKKEEEAEKPKKTPEEIKANQEKYRKKAQDPDVFYGRYCDG